MADALLTVDRQAEARPTLQFASIGHRNRRQLKMKSVIDEPVNKMQMMNGELELIVHVDVKVKM